MSAAQTLRITTLDAAIAAACDNEPANYSKAAQILMTILVENRELYDAAFGAMVASAAKELVSDEIRRRNRARYSHANAPVDQHGPADVRALVRVKQYTLMETAMATCGKVLRDATKEEVAEDARQFQARASGNAREAKWRIAITKRMKDGQTVGDVLTEEVLIELRKQVEK